MELFGRSCSFEDSSLKKAGTEQYDENLNHLMGINVYEFSYGLLAVM